MDMLDVDIDQKRVFLGMNVLHHNLEAVGATGLGNLDLVREPSNNEILVDDAV